MKRFRILALMAISTLVFAGCEKENSKQTDNDGNNEPHKEIISIVGNTYYVDEEIHLYIRDGEDGRVYITDQ